MSSGCAYGQPRATGPGSGYTLALAFIENAGNLVCPAEFDVGEHARVMVHSVTEGEDKPLKYPLMFSRLHVVPLNKIDLLPHLDIGLQAFLHTIAQTNPRAHVIRSERADR